MLSTIKVADEVWVATALLHRENPGRLDFSVSEIVDRVAKENISERLRPGVQVHVALHCVANKRPNPANHRMLFETVRGRRRLFRAGDFYHSYREGGKTNPNAEDLPGRYKDLFDWYKKFAKAKSGLVGKETNMQVPIRATAAEVRAYAFVHCVLPARQRGQKTVTIRAGDIHKAMGLSSRMPLVCGALGTKTFEQQYSLKRIRQTGPTQSTSTSYEFEI